MALTEEVQIRYELETAQYEANSLKIIKRQKEIAHSLAEGNIKLDQAEKEYAQLAAQQKKLNAVQEKTNENFKKLGGRVGKNSETIRGLQFFTQQVGFLASDAKYGLLGMGNNISLLLGLWPQLNAQIKQSGKSILQVVKGALLGSGGMLIAIQLLLSFGPEIVKFFKKWKNGSDEVSKATKELFNDIEQLKNKVKEIHETGFFEKDTPLENLVSSFNNIANSLNEGLSKKVLNWLDVFEKLSGEKGFAEKFKKASKGERKKIIEGLRAQYGDLDKVVENMVRPLIEKQQNLEAGVATGVFSPEEIAREELEIFKKKQDLLNVDKENYLKSSDYKKLLAKVTKAENEAALAESLKGENNPLERVRIEEQSKMDLLKSFRDQGLIDKETYEAGVTNIEETYAEKRKRISEIEHNQKVRDIQATLSAISGFLSNAAQLDQKNKGLARSAIIASGASAIVGAWDSWLTKDPTFAPGPWKVAGAVATTASVITATANSLKSLNANAAPGPTGGAQSNQPNFNIIGATSTNQLRETIENQQQNQEPVKAYIVESEAEAKRLEIKEVQEQTSF